MSQGDYIRHKKLINSLAQQTSFSQVLQAQPYTDFKQYSISKNIINAKTTFNLLTPTSTQIMFDMPLNKMTNCPEFIVCSGTDERPYRTASAGFVMDNGLPVMSNIASETETDSTEGKCTLDRSCTDDNSPCCKITHLRTVAI